MRAGTLLVAWLGMANTALADVACSTGSTGNAAGLWGIGLALGGAALAWRLRK